MSPLRQLRNAAKPFLLRDALYSGAVINYGDIQMNVQGIGKLAAMAALATAVFASPLRIAGQGGDTVLKPADTQKLLPAAAYYKGQSAPTQLRNSGGVKFADGYYVLAALVDTSGYSSDVATKYQGYFLAEVPLKIGSQTLPAGAYGIGFVENDRFVVTDIGAHDVLTTSSSSDEDLKRPVPLQVTPDPAGFRLYVGRKYVTFGR
jgi:hypothetical protein